MFTKGDWLLSRYRVEEDPTIGALTLDFVVYDWQLDKKNIMSTPKDEFLKDERMVEDFLRKSSLWVELGRHHNIVSARETETIDARPYLILEHVEAKTIRNRIDEGINMAESVNYAIQFCNGMDYVSSKRFKDGNGLVHRDFKPSNLLLTKDNVLKITGFMASKVVGPPSTETPSGTPPYMSPEQFETMDVDARSDIYSFGVVLYEMLLGRKPFPEPEQDRLASLWDYYRKCHRGMRPRAPHDINRDIKPELERIILKCLEKDPEDRYGNYDDLRRELFNIYGSFGEDKNLASLTAIGWNNAGFVSMEDGKYEEALSDFLKALEYDPDCIDALYNAGLSLMNLNRYEEAIQHMNKILRIDPLDEYARNARDKCARRIAPGPQQVRPSERPSEELGPCIEVMSGAMDGTEIRLTKEITNVGRRGDNDIILALDPYVSRAHARITFEEGFYWLEDMKSKNGTWKEGRKITEKEKLKNGDTFRMGDTWLQIRM